MRAHIFILVIFFGQLLTSCNVKRGASIKEHLVVEDVTLTSEEEDPGPPPPGFTSPFKTLREWLVNICDHEKPQQQIATYHLALFEGQGQYTLCLTGTNTYNVSQDHTSTRIDFAPKNMYFSLPKKEYQDLTRQKVLEKINSQLKEFITTAKFKQSFFAKANSITTDWNQEIWRR